VPVVVSYQYQLQNKPISYGLILIQILGKPNVITIINIVILKLVPDFCLNFEANSVTISVKFQHSQLFLFLTVGLFKKPIFKDTLLVMHPHPQISSDSKTIVLLAVVIS